MDSRIKLSLSDFKKIGPYEDPDHLSFNYYEQVLPDKMTDKSRKTYGQKMFYGYSRLSAQIENGGIAQYFWNTNGALLEDMNDLLEIIKLPKFTKLVSESVSIFKKNKATLARLKKRGVNGFEPWSELFGDKTDNYFFANQEKMEKIIYKFVTTHPEEFIK